jgi:hypothetical protein
MTPLTFAFWFVADLMGILIGILAVMMFRAWLHSRSLRFRSRVCPLCRFRNGHTDECPASRSVL